MTDIPVWLCDLTYTQQTIAADVIPAAIGNVAEFAKSKVSRPLAVKLFKYPENLARALDGGGAPPVIGFSNYVWNKDLGVQFATAVKRRYPETIIVFGGPNYPIPDDEREQWLRAHPVVDFYIVGDGETGFALLMEALIDADFQPRKVPGDLQGVHRLMSDGKADLPPVSEKIRDLNQIPSPYLSGALDEFFDGKLAPIIQTIRGCPFSCSFCTEGQFYHSKVGKTALDKLKAEFHLIAEKMARLRDGSGGRTDMYISDSNFGMYKEDYAVAEILAETRAEYGYPEYVQCSTGKNQKERVLEIAKILGGALSVSGEVQSLDATVMANIGRKNIDSQQIVELATEAHAAGSVSHTAVIMALPGDTLDAHLKTVRTVVEAGFNSIAVYQLMLLDGSDIGSRESREKWGMVTRHRVLPQCYGIYSVFGEELACAEIEDICVANNTFSLSDYMEGRKFNLVVNMFINDGVFRESLKLLELYGISKFDWLVRIYARIRDGACRKLFDDYTRASEEEIWEDPGELRAFTRRKGNIRRYLDGEFGANLVFNFKALALFEYPDEVMDVARQALVEMLDENGKAEALPLAKELMEFNRLRLKGLLANNGAAPRFDFTYDVEAFIREPSPSDVETYRLGRPVTYSFELSPAQKRTIKNLTNNYGHSMAGYGRIIARFNVRQLFRQPKCQESLSPEAWSLLRQGGAVPNGDRAQTV